MLVFGGVCSIQNVIEQCQNPWSPSILLIGSHDIWILLMILVVQVISMPSSWWCQLDFQKHMLAFLVNIGFMFSQF